METPPKKQYQFFNPITTAGQGGVKANFPLGLASLDFQHLEKNKPHFAELAVSFGLQTIKTQILKNTISFFKVKDTPNQKPRNFPPEVVHDKLLSPVGTSTFGFPVFSNLFIKGDTYKDNQGATVGRFEDIRVDTAIFECSRDHRIIQTDIQGRDNSVIEYISAASWRVNCKGRLLSRNMGAFPLYDTTQLNIALNSNQSFEVSSWYLNMLGIYRLSIIKHEFPQEEGGMEWQKFEFTATSDVPTILLRQL